jgi:chromosome segregation ATPase
VTERCETAEQQLEEVKLELQDVESVLHTHEDEMSSLHLQLEEVRESFLPSFFPGREWRGGSGEG